jgi:hypothetical protein
VIVADYFSVREFNGRTGRPGAFESVFGSAGTVGAFGDDIVMTGWVSGEVQIISGDTLQLVSHLGLFAGPLNAISFQGDVAVAEIGTGSVVRGDHSPIASGLFVPTGLAANDTELWVADWATGVVWQIVSGGLPLATPIAVAGGLAFPEGLALNTDGSLLVVESGIGRLSRIDLNTGQVTTVADGLELGAEGVPGLVPTWIFNGVAVGPSGHIYVTGDKSNVLYRFKQHP